MQNEELLLVPFGEKTTRIDLRGLEAEGFRVFQARDPFEGLIHAHRRPFPTVLLDFSDFRQREQNVLTAFGQASPQSRMLALVANSVLDEVEELRRAGILGVLPKPFELPDLLTLLQTTPQNPRSRIDLERTRTGAPLPDGGSAPMPSRCLELLKDWMQLLTRDLNNIEEILTLALDLPVKELKARRASLLLFDESREVLRMRRWVGFPADVDPRSIRIRPGEGISGVVAQKGDPLLVGDLHRTENVEPSLHRSYVSSSLLSVPIRHGSTILGVLNLTDKEDGSAFTLAERELVTALAQQAAAFIENARLLKKMETLSIVDELTGLFNRRYFEQCLENETIRARRYKRFLTLALLDIDNFKVYNDTNGYLKGDQVLRGVARILRENFRKTDIVTRWGGEEFAVLLPETEKPDLSRPNAALHFTERVRHAVESERFATSLSMEPTRVTLSGGVATFPTDTLHKEDLLAKANTALKRAKTSGKNQICVFGEQG